MSQSSEEHKKLIASMARAMIAYADASAKIARIAEGAVADLLREAEALGIDSDDIMPAYADERHHGPTKPS